MIHRVNNPGTPPSADGARSAQGTESPAQGEDSPALDRNGASMETDPPEEAAIDDGGDDPERTDPERTESGALESSASAEGGEPVAFRTRLDHYAGPLDLLLYLIHKNEVDILDIPIALILDQYLRHIRDLDARSQLDLREAGEYLLMAGRLMEIKSRLLLPVEPSDEDEILDAELEDPRVSLVEQLLEYREIKERAGALEDVYRERSLRYERPSTEIPPPPPDTLDLAGTNLFDLAAALERVLADAAARDRVAVIAIEDVPIEETMHEVRLKLQAQPGHRSRFEDIFDVAEGVRGVIRMFLAVLEMAKLKLLTVSQSAEFDGIELLLRPDVEDAS